MKVSPIASSGATVGAMPAGDAAPSMAQRVRSLRINTNATPGREYEGLQPPPAATPGEQTPASPQQLAISDANNDTTKPDEATQPLSPQLAAIAKQRRALQSERQAFEKERADFEAQRQSGTGGIDRERFKSDPLGVMLEEGITYEQLQQAVIENQDFNPEIRALKEEIKALKANVDKTLTERDTSAKQAALGEMRREATQLVSQGDEFEMVRETRSIPHVMQLIERTYDETGEVLDVREALRLVEEDLFNESLKLANLKKVQAKLTPTPPALPPQQQQRQMRTLTNRDTASVPMSAKARAIAAFYGNLKK